MFDLTGKCALVTGASGGIGRTIAQQLKAQGAVVGLSGTRVDSLQALASELGDGAYVLPADLSSAEVATQLIADATAAMGRIDILVNNAGLTRDTLAMRMKDDDWQLILDVNLTSAFRLSKACLRGMMKKLVVERCQAADGSSYPCRRVKFVLEVPTFPFFTASHVPAFYTYFIAPLVK